jgi:alpha-glucosidase
MDEFHFPFNPGFIGVEWKVEQVRQFIDEVEAALPEGAWPNAHTGNFDEWRVVSRFGETGARQAALLLLTMRGTPLIYYGEEIGMTNVVIPPEFEQDPMGKRIGLNRDPQRTPMQWDPGPHAGFSDHTTPRLWLPVSSNYRQINVERELADPHSMLNLYRALIALRRRTPALVAGSYTPIEGIPEEVYAFLRQAGEQQVLVALNFSQQACGFSLPQPGRGEILLNTRLDRTGRMDLANLELGPQEAIVIELTG